MSSHLIFDGMDEAARKDLEHYWARKKMPQLNRLLSPVPPEQRDLWLTVRRQSKNGVSELYHARAVIHLPTGMVAVEAEDKGEEAVLDQVAEALAARIRRHLVNVRKDIVFERKGRQRNDLNVYESLLQQDVLHGRKEDFFRLLRPLLRFLGDHVRRELRILELEGTLHRNEVTVADVLDEVLVRSWERFKDRPQNMPLDVWLTRLAHEVLDQLINQEFRPHGSLETNVEEALPEKSFLVDEKEWWNELPAFEETALLEDVVPDSIPDEAWHTLNPEVWRDRLLSLVAELPPTQRQAFLLNALEDFEPSEIALLQERPENQVKADLEAARRTLRERLGAGADLKKEDREAASPGTITATREI